MCAPVGKCCCITSAGWTAENTAKAFIPAALAAIALAATVVLILHRQGILASPLSSWGETGILCALGVTALFSFAATAVGLAIHAKKVKREAKEALLLSQPTPTPRKQQNPVQVTAKVMNAQDAKKKGLDDKGIFQNPDAWEKMPSVLATWKEIEMRIQPAQFWIVPPSVPSTPYYMLLVKISETKMGRFYCANEDAAFAKVQELQPVDHPFTDGSTAFKETHYHNSQAFDLYSTTYSADTTTKASVLLKDNTYLLINYDTFSVVHYKVGTNDTRKIFYKANDINESFPEFAQDKTKFFKEYQDAKQVWTTNRDSLNEKEMKLLLKHYEMDAAILEEHKTQAKALQLKSLKEISFAEKNDPPVYCLIVNGYQESSSWTKRLSSTFSGKHHVYYFRNQGALETKKQDLERFFSLSK